MVDSTVFNLSSSFLSFLLCLLPFPSFIIPFNSRVLSAGLYGPAFSWFLRGVFGGCYGGFRRELRLNPCNVCLNRFTII